MAVILVVEDDAQLGHIFGRMLEKAGFQVAHADTTTDAIRMCEDLIPDGILLDLNAPNDGSLKMIEYVRQHDEFQDTSVVALSTHTDYASFATFAGKIKGKIDRFLNKPITPSMLTSAFQQM